VTRPALLAEAEERTRVLQAALRARAIPRALFTDESAIAYLGGFWGYLGVEFGRPTLLLVPAEGEPVLVTPLMESRMAEAMTWIADVRPWEDSGPRGWAVVLADLLGSETGEALWVERGALPALVRGWFDEARPATPLEDVGPILGAQRMIKSPLEIEVMRQAGRVAGAMMAAAHASLKPGAPEYRSALAVIEAGTEAAAGFLTADGWERFVSPLIHNLAILQSGADTAMVHRRASVKPYEVGDPVYFCFCTMAQFKQYKLGFDRLFHIGRLSREAERAQQTAIDAQRAALDAIRPGVAAEDVAAAADAVYRAHGFEAGYRTGRSIGVAYLEAPELKAGDRTVLQPGMTFAVDGGVSLGDDLGGRIGDSIVVTEDGFEFLTDYPREIMVTPA